MLSSLLAAGGFVSPKVDYHALAPEFVFKRKQVTRKDDTGLQLQSRNEEPVAGVPDRREARS